MLSQICLSVCLSVTRLDQSKTVEVRIMQFSPYSSPIPLILQDRFHPEIPRDPPSPASNKGRLGETYYFRSSNAFTRWLHKLELLSQLRCQTSNLVARWRHCRALTVASAGLSCYYSGVWLSGVHFATGRTGDGWTTGGSVPRQNRAMDEDF